MSIFACIDTETTGLLTDPSAHVVEVAVVLYDSESDCVVDSYDTIVNPPTLTEEGLAISLKISGLTEAQIRAGLPPEVAWSKVAQLVGSYKVTAWNVDFDRKFCRRTFLGFEESSRFTLVDPTQWTECACERFTDLFQSIAGTYTNRETGEQSPRFISLARAAWITGFRWNGAAHRALTDANMAARVYAAMLRGDLELPEVGHEHQIGG